MAASRIANAARRTMRRVARGGGNIAAVLSGVTRSSIFSKEVAAGHHPAPRRRWRAAPPRSEERGCCADYQPLRIPRESSGALCKRRSFRGIHGHVVAGSPDHRPSGEGTVPGESKLTGTDAGLDASMAFQPTKGDSPPLSEGLRHARPSLLAVLHAGGGLDIRTGSGMKPSRFGILNDVSVLPSTVASSGNRPLRNRT